MQAQGDGVALNVQRTASAPSYRVCACGWTGTGVSIASNKVAGVRAALCTDAETARGAHRWNDANVFALGLRLTSPELAREMVAAFLSTEPDAAEATTIRRVEGAG
ncbi:MAG: RpiB/LacA/LacB family sugar-phosphate isomerase [Acidimicrobiia bacterium]|nr:RpiB/LacA/LacB family sugar-phosphate isomerase [Acidimicrobiia bacterium]